MAERHPKEFKVRRIGIALAAYRPNHDHLATQLESIADQTFKDWVCVLAFDSPIEELNGNSRLQELRRDPRFIWTENAVRLGHKKNFERAMQLALAQPQVNVIGCSDQDDLWYPNKLEISARALENSGPRALVHTNMHSWDGSRTLKRTVWEIERRGVRNVATLDLLVRNVVAGCSMLMDAELVKEFPLIPEAAEYHDHWYALVASCFGGVHPVWEPLFAYRQHGENVVGVTEFRGTFALPPGSTVGRVIEKARAGWLKSNRLAIALDQAGLKLTGAARAEFLGRRDGGTLLVLMGFLRFSGGDKPLARACWARGLGKLASFAPLRPA